MQKEPRYKTILTPQIEIKSKQQFGSEAQVHTSDNDSVRLGYGLGYGLYDTRYGRVFFKEGHLEGGSIML